MSNTIVVPYDGSPTSRRALPYAATFAKLEHDARILLLTVLPTAEGPDMLTKGPWLGEFEKAADERLRAAAARLRRRGAKHVETRQEWSRHTAEEIISSAEEANASLIVLGTRGRSGLGRALVGSVALRLMQHSPIPCAFVPPGAQITDASIGRALLAVDGDESSDAAIDVAEDLAASGVDITVLRAVNNSADLLPIAVPGAEGAIPLPHADLVDEAQRYVEAVAGAMPEGRGSGIVATGRPAESILQSATEIGADIIVMSTHGRSTLGRAVLGSVADQVVRTSKIPVVVARPRDTT